MYKARQGQEEVTDHVNRVEENKTPGDLQTSGLIHGFTIFRFISLIYNLQVYFTDLQTSVLIY